MTTKASLVNRISADLNITKKYASEILEAVVFLIKEDLLTEGTAVLPGIGKLKVKARTSRQGRNPRTGDPITIPARNVLKLVTSKSTKQEIQV